MLRQIRRLLLLSVITAALAGLLAVGAGAYSYPSMPDNWRSVRVTVGEVTMPLSLYPDGSYFNSEKDYMSVSEQLEYGFNSGSTISVRGWQCVGFARYVFAALYYRYPQDASIDTSLGTGYSNNYAYRNMIEEVFGTRSLAPGYSASELKTLFTACRPGAVFSTNSHTMVLMAIYDDGFLIYDANFSSSSEVDVRAYTWDSFVRAQGSRGIQGLHMPVYYPGYSYSTGSGSFDGTGGGESVGSEEYNLVTESAGRYIVYDCTALNVRSSPSLTGLVVGKLYSGDVVQINGTYQGWAQITYDGSSRWISAEYIRKPASVTVSFDAAGGSCSFSSRQYDAGLSYDTLPTAEKSGRNFLGWADSYGNIITEKSTAPRSSITLKAKWSVAPYTDVPDTAWYASHVESAYARGLITADTLFNPQTYATRAQMITILGREYERESGYRIRERNYQIFSDVPVGSYYNKYVNWGYEMGIVSGISPTEFNPNGLVTREQIVEFLYRLAIYCERTTRTAGDMSLLSGFHDGATVSRWAQGSICWAVQNSLLAGDDLGNINPQSPARRSEMIAIYSRYVAYSRITSAHFYTGPKVEEQTGSADVEEASEEELADMETLDPDFPALDEEAEEDADETAAELPGSDEILEEVPETAASDAAADAAETEPAPDPEEPTPDPEEPAPDAD